MILGAPGRNGLCFSLRDTLMTLVVNTKNFNLDNYGSNAAFYYGPAHTLSLSDDIRLGKVYPKPTVVFSGVGRSAAKLTRSLTLTGALTPTALAILDISGSFPVGAAGADIDAMCNDMGSFLSSASGKLWAKNLQTSF